MIETWAFYIFAPPGRAEVADLSPEAVQASYDAYMDLWVKCEDWGFDGLVFAEHHFAPPTCLSPSPHLVVAAVAQRTKHIRLTTLGSVLPMHDARRYVEECAMLHYLTGGRFEPGIAPGASGRESIASGVPEEDIRPRYHSGADLLVKALASRVVTHKDKFSNLENVQIVPPLRLHPGQAAWVAAMSPESAAWAAERGFKMCIAWLPTSVAAALAERYRGAADAAGRASAPSMLGMRRRVLVAETDEEAQERYEQAFDRIRASTGSFETADPKVRQLLMHPDDFAIGSPETVAEKLISQCRAGGYGAVMAFLDFAQFAPGVLQSSHQLMATRVAPRLRSAEIGAKGDVTLPARVSWEEIDRMRAVATDRARADYFGQLPEKPVPAGDERR